MRACTRHVVVACGLLAAGAIAPAASAKQFIPDLYAMTPVTDRLVVGDCPGAVAALNDGLRSGKPELYLQAGTMYEEGLCLKRDWSKAMQFYSQAHDAGHPSGAWRLAAGFASEAGGSDLAAALWWANVNKPRWLGICTVDVGDAGDAERFVEVLRSWPAGKLRNCGYVVGVLSSLNGDLEFPHLGVAYGLDAKLSLDFVPADGRLDVRTVEVHLRTMHRAVTAERMNERDSKDTQALFERYVSEVAERALKRYDRPAGIDPAWTFTELLTFNLYER